MYYSQIIPKLSLSSGVMTDTVNASVGRTMALEKTINYKGYKGSGYIIIDPQTGRGAYLIDGGANGTLFIALGLWLLVITIAFFEFSFMFAAQMLITGFGFIVMGYGILTNNEDYCEHGLAMVLGGTLASIFELPAIATEVAIGAGIMRSLDDFSFLGKASQSDVVNVGVSYLFGSLFPDLGLNDWVCGRIK